MKRLNKNAITNEDFACLRVGGLKSDAFLLRPLDNLTVSIYLFFGMLQDYIVLLFLNFCLLHAGNMCFFHHV